MPANKVIRKDLVEDSVFNVGRDFATSLQPGIESTIQWKTALNELKAAALAYNKIENDFKISDSRLEFLKLKQEEDLLRKKAANSIKTEKEALIAIQKVKQAELDTDRKKEASEARKQKAQKTTIKLTELEKLEIRLLNRGKREAVVISSKLSTEYEKQSVKLTQLRRKYKDVALTQGESSNQAKRLAEQIRKLDASLKKVDANVGQFQRSVGNYGVAMNSARNAARSLASAMGFVGGAFLVVQVVSDAIGVIRDFEKANATLSAILQVERSEMQGLTDDSIRLGESTVKTAAQVTGLQIAYARLGFSQQQIIELTEPTINGSIALNAELDKTAGLVGAVVNTFDDFEAANAPEIIDQLSLATSKSALNFEKLEKGVPIVAGAANAAGIPFTRLIALMGKLSDSGIDVSTSSTALRNIFIESAAQGLNYSEIVQKIKDSQDKLTASNDEFGKRAAVSATVLAQNIDKTEELDIALQGAAGTAESMANKELDTLDGSLKLIRSAFEGYILNLNDSTSAGNTLKDSISFLAKNFSEIVSGIGIAIKAYLGYVVVTKLASLQTALVTRQMVVSRTVAIASARGINIASLAWVKFSAVLKANALGLAFAALAGIIILIQKYNKNLGESIATTNEATASFLESRAEQQKTADSLEKMADRYNELTGKTELNKEEQKELETIIAKIAKTVPKSVVEIDKYGKALKLNTEEVDKFNEANENLSVQLEATLLKENTAQLAALEKQQKSLNNITKEGVGFYVEGVGRVASYNNQLKQQVVQSGRNADVLKEGNELSAEQQELVRDFIKGNQDAINEKKNFIETLSEEGRATALARREAELKAKADLKTAQEANFLSGQKDAEILKVSELKEKISELKKEQDGLTDNDGARAGRIIELIDLYQKRINSILGVSSANKTASQAEKERLKAIEKLAADAFALKKFYLDKEIEAQNAIVKDDSASFPDREVALKEVADSELKLAEEIAKRKLSKTQQFSDGQSSYLLNNALADNEVVKKLSDEQLVILEQFEQSKKQIQEREENGKDSLEVDRIKENAAKAKAETEKAINDEIAAENRAFLAKEGIYADDLNAVETRERRIAEIKRKYALEGLNAQLLALETLINQSEEGSLARIEAEAKVAKAKADIAQLDVDAFLDTDSGEGEVASSKERASQILQISSDLANALGDLGSSIFDGRIQKIDDEIDANDAKFENLLDNENLTATEREAIEEKQEKAREALEAKKRKEQRKQAILSKAIAALNIGLLTAQNILGALAPPPVGLGPLAGIPLSISMGVIGAIQAAAVLAAPIPSYFKGTDNHIGGLAMVGEVRPEVIQEPNKQAYIVDKPSVLDLPKGTKVTPSVEEYENLFRASVMSSLEMEDNKISAHEARQTFNTHNNFQTKRLERLLEDLKKETRRANSKAPVFNGKIVIEQPLTRYN